MEEKILIKSERYNIGKLFAIFLIIGLLLSVLGTVICFADSCDYYNNHKHDKYCYMYSFKDEFYKDQLNGGVKEYKMDCRKVVYGSAFAYAVHEYFSYQFINCIIPLVSLTLIGGLIYLWLRSYELTITDKRVFGKVAWGKRVDLPIDSVSAVGTGAFKSINISTSSGRVGFSAIKNRNEIHEIMSNLLIERQKQNTASEQANTTTSTASNADELKKYKELFDAGIITQEEFDAKKKQLLNL